MIDFSQQSFGAAPTTVVVPDATRPLAYDTFLPPLCQALIQSGSPTTIVVGLGLHRPMTDDELTPLYRAVADLPIAIEQHDPQGDLVDLGPAQGLPSGAPKQLPIALNRRVVEARRLICVGTVEPHQYAGFSGGIKAVAIGCSGEATIAAMHGLSLLREERTQLGALADNPFQQCLWQIGASLDHVLGLQIVPTGGVVEPAFFGDLRSAFERACAVASRQFFEPFKSPVDWLHLPVPALKAANFYQASRAATYAALVDRPAIRRGQPILIEAACPEGIGTGRGEQACAKAMRRGRKILLRELRDGGVNTRGGQQRAYVLARACQRNPIALIGAPPIDALAAMGIAQYDSIDQAMADLNLAGRPGRRIPNIFRAIPRLSDVAES